MIKKMIEWLKQQYTKMHFLLPYYIARDCRDEFKEILTENKRFEYEVTDTGKYYYDNGKRIFPEDFWQIIHDLNEENEQLKSFIKGNCIWCEAYLEPQYRNKFGGD